MRKWLILPDVHAPQHDERAWKLVLKVAKAFKPYGIVILGDFADCWSASSHRKDPKKLANLGLELDSCNHLLDDLDKLKAKRKVYIFGNHEHRVYRYLADHAPALADLVNVEGPLRLKQRGYEVIPYKDSITIADTKLTHDLDRAGKHAVHQAVEESASNIVIGHLHRFDYCAVSAYGRTLYGMSPGWLGDCSRQDYKHRIKAEREWQLGFAVGYEEREKLDVEPILIREDYSCRVGEKLYRVP